MVILSMIFAVIVTLHTQVSGPLRVLPKPCVTCFLMCVNRFSIKAIDLFRFIRTLRRILRALFIHPSSSCHLWLISALIHIAGVSFMISFGSSDSLGRCSYSIVEWLRLLGLSAKVSVANRNLGGSWERCGVLSTMGASHNGCIAIPKSCLI